MKKTAIIIMFITIISKISGFARDVTLSYFYGASNISDAYLIASTIPNVIFSFIGAGISTGYIPMYSQIEQESGEEVGNRFTNNLINMLIIVSTIFILLGLLYTKQIVKIFASGFDGESLVLAIEFTRLNLFGIYFTMLIYIYNGYLQIKGNFIVPALIGIPMNFIIIASIFLSTKTNIIVLSFGIVIAKIAQLLFIIPFAKKKGYSYKFVLNKQDDKIRKMASLGLPVIIGVSVNQINALIDRTIASRIVMGGVSALNYANQLNLFIQGLFVLPLATVMYPLISKMVVEKNISDLKKSVSEAISVVNLLVIPATVGSMIFSEPVVKLLFGRGAFDVNAIRMTSYCLFFYSLGMIGFGLREVLSRTFYSLQDTKTPIVNAAIAMIMNIILNILLSKYMGIGGLALATSLSAIFCTGLLFISLSKKIGPFGMKQISISFLKILFASLIMGTFAKFSFNHLTASLSQNLSLLISIGIGAISYFIIIYFMKIEDVDVMVEVIKKKLGRSAG